MLTRHPNILESDARKTFALLPYAFKEPVCAENVLYA